MMKNIVLIGMRGSGKSHIGRLLGEKLGMDFFDNDTEVEKQSGKSIKDIVATDGWEVFRDLESDAVKMLAAKSGAVIATGGGVVLREKNIIALKKHGVIIFLNVPIQDLEKRIAGKELSIRPSLTGKNSVEELRSVWLARKKTYFDAADIVVDCPNISDDKKSDIEEHTKEIIVKLKSFGGKSLHNRQKSPLDHSF